MGNAFQKWQPAAMCMTSYVYQHDMQTLIYCLGKYISSDSVYVEKIVFCSQKHATSICIIVLSVSIVISMEIRDIIFKASRCTLLLPNTGKI